MDLLGPRDVPDLTMALERQEALGNDIEGFRIVGRLFQRRVIFAGRLARESACKAQNRSVGALAEDNLLRRHI